MSDDRPEETTPSPDLGRPKRTPPTIDLEATEISTARRADDGAGVSPPPDPEPSPAPEAGARVQRRFSPLSSRAFPAPVAAALVIGVGWMLGWPQLAPNAPAAPQLNAAAIDGLPRRIASVEAKSGKSAAAAPDPALAARLQALEKSLASLRGELAARGRNRTSSPPRSIRSRRPRAIAPLRRICLRSTNGCPRSNAPTDPERRDRAAECQAGRRHVTAPGGGGVPARSVGAAGRSLCRGVDGGEIAEPGPGCAEAAGAICRHRHAECGQSQPRAAHAGAKTVAARRRRCADAAASSIGCRRAPRGWCASSAPTPPAMIAAR